MGNRYVRVYQGPENANVIGFSTSATPGEKENFEGFLEDRGYNAERLTIGTERYDTLMRGLGGVSASYFGIEPPLRDEDQESLAAWCRDNIDTSHDSGYVIDHRNTPHPIHSGNYRGEVVAHF